MAPGSPFLQSLMQSNNSPDDFNQVPVDQLDDVPLHPLAIVPTTSTNTLSHCTGGT